jgi:hypothetical protein
MPFSVSYQNIAWCVVFASTTFRADVMRIYKREEENEGKMALDKDTPLNSANWVDPSLRSG